MSCAWDEDGFLMQSQSEFYRELNEIPWINVVESVRAYDEYEHNGKVDRITHRTFAIASPRSVTAKRLERAQHGIVRQLVLDTYLRECDEMYPWEKAEGAMAPEFDEREIAERMPSGIPAFKFLIDRGCMPALRKDHSIWLSIRMPWEIRQNNEKSIMWGRFGTGIFHKDAKWWEPVY